MQGNDLSNDFQPCFLVLFEGLLGLPRKEQRTSRRWNTRNRPRIADYEINRLLLDKIRLTPYPVEVVTFLGPKFAKEIEQRLEDLHALVRKVWNTTPEELARIHLTLPDVEAIYDPDPMRALLTYGRLGRHMLPENAPGFGEQ